MIQNNKKCIFHQLNSSIRIKVNWTCDCMVGWLLSVFVSSLVWYLTNNNKRCPWNQDFPWPIHCVLIQCTCISKLICVNPWQNQQHECAPSEDSNQPGHPRLSLQLKSMNYIGGFKIAILKNFHNFSTKDKSLRYRTIYRQNFNSTEHTPNLF